MTRELRDSEAALRRSAERDAFRLALTDAIRPLIDPTAVKNEAARVLGMHLRASRVVYAEVLPDGQLVIERSYTDGVSDMPGRHYVDDHSALLLRELRAGRNIVVADVTNDPAFIEADKERYRAAQIVASLVVPLLKDGQLIAVLGVHQSTPRRWTTEDVALAEETAERTWSEVERARAEAAVRDRESLLSLAFDAADLMLFTWDIPKDRVERRMSRIPVLPSSNGVGRGPTTFAEVIEVVHPDDRVRFEAAVRAALAGSGPYAQAYRVVQPDGSVLWIEEQGRVSFDAIGRPVRLVGVATDVTARRAAERAVQESEARLRLALDASDTGLWTWDVRTGAVGWSPECYRILGVPEGAFKVTGAGFFCLVHPDDRERVERTVRAAIDDHSLFECEFRIVRPNGDVAWLENRGRASYDADGRPLQMLGTATDVTARKRVEEELARSEAFARSVVESSADCVKGLTLDGKLLWMNENGKRLMEICDFASVKGCDWASFWDSAGLRAEAEAALAAARAGRIGRFRGFRTTFAGTPRWWDVAITAVPGPDGMPEQLLVVSRDITDAREAEEAVRKSEELLTRAQRAGRVGIWDWNVVTGEANWTEESWRLFGHPPFSRPVTHELWLESVHPDDREQMVAKVQEALRSGKYAAEYRVRHADGTVRWVESRGETEFAPDGRPLRMLGTSRDVTERRVAEEKLRRREWELQTLADNSPDILTRFDPNLRHVFVNAAVLKVTGRQREEYLGKTNRELGMPADLCQLWEDALRSVFGTGLQRSIEFAFPTAAGIRHYSARLVPEFGPESTVEYVISVTHDVTDHKRYEEALRDQDRRKDEFLATLAHELRNPLAPIRNGLQILRLAPDGEDALEIREMMERQLAHMVRLIDDLLDVSRISRGKFELKRELVQVQDVLDHAIETSQPLIEAGRHELIIQPPDEPVWLDGDLTRLAQVVSNLLNNSAKYTPNGGRITLSAGFEGDNAIIRVTDNGSGISAEMLTQVFEMFTQVDRTLDRAQGGLGIGLSLVRRLVEMHGGTIAADSPGLGLGSVFTVRLPVALPPMTRSISGTPPERPERSSTSSTLRVLMVDDSDDGATSLALLLQVWGHTTRISHDGPQAIEAAREFRPDIVFLDIGLPVMDGYEVCRRLRDNPDLSRTIFVALTGWGGEEDKKRAQDAGFAFHLVKPVNPDQIEDVLKKTVEGREGTESNGGRWDDVDP
ncbi:MAG: PAS domain-containing protein [Isosphaeraceae bacterium]